MSTPLQHDFRSDTVTRPSAAMRQAIANAEVGDDVFGDDPTVKQLEAHTAEVLGKEAALFVPSGTQSNLIALMAHCERGDEYIVGQEAHCYRWEAGGAAVLGSIQPQPVENEADGTLPLAKIEAAIKPNDPHFARTKLLALENTIGGKILPPAYVHDAVDLARGRGLACHLDGARLFNAAVALEVPAATLARPFDTVSVCLSKGLGAPVGSVLVGPGALIAKGRRLRKLLGGAMRQAGVLAAAGLYALEHNIARLALDHANAKTLARGLAAFPGISVVDPHTNIVFVEVDPRYAAAFSAHLAAHGIGITSAYGATRQRWATHLDVDGTAVERALAVAADFFAHHA
ncbi:low-specificity L-threonine aldolase [Trinickia caryophylli]|uniref:L-threonine aldolase n=1 Tax=Trinickia caryophylli TaxID=28094 RepID=A0A1X7CVF2_TRICW|nr:low-specificity L-threonine aldolase [Trinickia caryophylli]PMS13410.1 low-specificity L-threonine aldolase [Trinickia caryophylli]TRX13729.1 low-specificity L-threonine aldolase [Trinickia caryophylli]WQE15320.1 low-specificity L-threonine aldolase [Trinickia caryophylli]SMF03813.1 L-threonine aldolase [Trinickia caryophylli]GLU30925.1 threonine aldolase [Trinickia caryophylli]